MTARVLVVDDDGGVRALLARVVSDSGLSAVAASTVSEAIAVIVADEPLRGVLSDYDLPDGTGLQILQAAHARHPGATLVLLSGRAVDAAERRVAANLGARFIAKPFEVKELQVVLDSISSA